MKDAQRLEAARLCIRTHGARLTQPRTAVLAAMIGAHQALSHSDVIEALPAGHEIDRVTVYRVLEWLTDMGIAHRIAGDDRVWRFTLTSAGGSGHEHAHFACTQCGKVECLPKISTAAKFRLPRGYQLSDVELTIKGVCGHCGERPAA
jgi:Fur family transcriptional regulator, ferric uptake regulator